MTPNLQHYLSTSISIAAIFSSNAKAKTALRALTPDNINFPEGLSLKMFLNGPVLIIKVESKNVPMVTIINTLDEVLEHIALIRRVIQE